MDKIVFATGNENKMIEIRMILEDLGIEILSQREAGITADVIEDGATFEENAMIKAREIAKYTDAIVLADDSGLEIDYLNKEPGIYSARYMGENTSYDIKNQALLDRLVYRILRTLHLEISFIHDMISARFFIILYYKTIRGGLVRFVIII